MNTLLTQSMGGRNRTVFLLLFFFLLSYILPLGIRDLVVPDETRYGEIPREMIADGDWVVPHLNGLRYFEKPVMGYWVHAGALLLFGENNFAVRLPSAMAVGLSALLVYALMNPAYRNKGRKNRLAPILTSLIFLSCFEVFAVGNTAVLDSLFSCLITATIAAFYFAAEAPPGSARENRFLILSGVSCGLAFLTKGFLAFAVPVLALAPYLAWQRRYSDLLRMSWLPVLTAVLVALPWGILIHLREPDFWRFFIWNEHFRRFMADNAQHKESFWFFFVTAPGMFLPWTFWVPAAMPGIKERLNEQSSQGRLIRLSICWLVLPFLFFSVSSGKLLTYILPCFPPFAIIITFGLIDAHDKKGRNKIFQWGIVIAAILSGLVLLATLYVGFVGFKGFRPFREPWKTMMVVNSMVFFILFHFFAFKNQKRTDKVLLLCMAPLFLFFIIHFTIPDLTLAVKVPGPLLEQNKQNVSEDDVIISDESTTRAVCWYLKRKDVYVLLSPGEFQYGLSYADADGRYLDLTAAADLIRRNPGKTVLIARAKNISPWRAQLPKPAYQDESGPCGHVFLRY